MSFLFNKVFGDIPSFWKTSLSPGMVYPAQNEKLVQKLKEKNITCFAMDAWLTRRLLSYWAVVSFF